MPNKVVECMKDSLARKILHVEEVSMASYDKDPEAPAYVVDGKGEGVLEVVAKSNVFVPRFCYKSSHQVFGPIKATKDRIRQEEQLVLTLLESITTDLTLPGKISEGLLEAACGMIGEFDVEVGALVISTEDIPEFESELSLTFEEDDTYSLVEATGKTSGGVVVYAHPLCPKGRAYMTQEALYLGRVCVPELDSDKCGMVIFNPRPVVHLTFE